MNLRISKIQDSRFLLTHKKALNPATSGMSAGGMGESNILLEQRKRFTSRTHMAAIAESYRQASQLPDGTVPASFEFITMTGWKESL